MPDYLLQLLAAAPPASVIALATVSAPYCVKGFLAMVATFGRGEPRRNAERVLKILVRPKRPRGS